MAIFYGIFFKATADTLVSNFSFLVILLAPSSCPRVCGPYLAKPTFLGVPCFFVQEVSYVCRWRAQKWLPSRRRVQRMIWHLLMLPALNSVLAAVRSSSTVGYVSRSWLVRSSNEDNPVKEDSKAISLIVISTHAQSTIQWNYWKFLKFDLVLISFFSRHQSDLS